MMKRLFLIIALGWACPGISQAQVPDTLFITTSQVVHLRFDSELKYVSLGSKDIVAKIVDGSKDFMAVKAREVFEGCTSLSCLESTGAMHTFLVAYRERPSRLEVDTRSNQKDTAPMDTVSFSKHSISDIVHMRQDIYHIGTRGYGIDILCENIFVKDDTLFLLISVKNGSAISYEFSTPHFAVESPKRSRRGLQYEKAVSPKQTYGLGTVAPGGKGKLVFTFDKLTLLKRQVFRMYFYEKGGSRNFTVSLNGDDVNKAKVL